MSETEVVPAQDIERIVGAKRMPTNHVMRLVTEEDRAYILHSEWCVRGYPDLRECPFSVALGEYGLWGTEEEERADGEGYDWPEDRPFNVMINEDGFLAPDHANTKLLGARYLL